MSGYGRKIAEKAIALQLEKVFPIGARAVRMRALRDALALVTAKDKGPS